MFDMKLKTKDIILIAMFSAITIVLSQIIIPLPFTPVPISLSTLAFFMAGGLLGPVRGSISQIVYVLLGAIGLPVFGGFSGGASVIFGPTGGYIIGYVVGAFVIGLLIKQFPQNILGYSIAMFFGITTCYVLGTLWFMFVMDMKLIESLMLCVIPYIPGDILKIALAAILVKRLRGVV